MNRLLTTLLVWLLMATLPLHALAASVNLSCTPVPHHMGAPSGQGHTAPERAADDMHAHHGGHAADANANADDDADGGEAADLPHSSCSACSVFCVGAVAPPSAPLSLPGAIGSESVAVASADVLTGFIPDGPQRPPRP